MDLDEWEFLPDHGFLDLNGEDCSDKKIFSGKHDSSKPSTVFNMNYFMCPSSPVSQKVLQPPPSPPSPGGEKFSRKVGAFQQVVVPVPIQLEPRFVKKKNPDDEIAKDVILTEKINSEDLDFGSNFEADQDAVSKVFFKKMKENEFVDMKMDSPKSPTSSSRNIMTPQLEAAEAMEKSMSSCCSPRKKKPEMEKKPREEELDWEEEDNNGGFDLWKWSSTGIGAICSFGVAAATMCIIIFGSHQRTNNKKLQQNQKLRFQIYADDKRIKQVVQQASKLNEAISAVRGAPITRAHITIGGYYDSL